DVYARQVADHWSGGRKSGLELRLAGNGPGGVGAGHRPDIAKQPGHNVREHARSLEGGTGAPSRGDNLTGAAWVAHRGSGRECSIEKTPSWWTSFFSNSEKKVESALQSSDTGDKKSLPNREGFCRISLQNKRLRHSLRSEIGLIQ